MKRAKVIISLILVLCLTFCVAGCSSNHDEGSLKDNLIDGWDNWLQSFSKHALWRPGSASAWSNTTPSHTKRCPRSLKACGAAHGTRAAQLSTTSSLKTRFPTRMCGRHSFIWIKTVCPAYNAKSIRLPVQAATNICSRCRSAEYREAIFE